ncbi:MAG: helix-turn-helix transcriptional regulator [Pseudothermotoga sp.]
MDFSQRLSLLKNVLGVSNAALAKALSVDPSLVSRWKNGTRTPSRNSQHIDQIASFFAQHAKKDYQKLAICEVIGIPAQNLEKESLKNIIKSWLDSVSMPDTNLIDGFLNKVGMFKTSPVHIQSDIASQSETEPTSGQKIECEIFYGVEGKQRGVMKFLSFALRNSQPSELLLYSDEAIDWFAYDKAYLSRLGGTLITLAMKGWKIKMVHTVTRDITEMLAAIDFWLPLYMTGSVTPYYNPKYREHYFRRTLFVIPKIAAFTCTTLEKFEQQTVNFLITEKQIVELLTQEYERFLSTCRPLMEIPQIGSDELFSLLEDFEEQPSNGFTISYAPSITTMPGELLEKILSRHQVEMKEKIMAHWRKKSSLFERSLRKCKMTHVLVLPSVESLTAGQAEVPIELPEAGVELFYTPQEYVEHLESVISFLKKYDNYNLYLAPRTVSEGVFVAVKDQVGVVVFKKDPPVRMFAINHPDMTNAFYCYAEEFINKLPLHGKQREQVIRAIENLIDSIRGNTK